MPDVREVYEMVTKDKPSDPGALDRQRTRQIRTMRSRKIGAIAVTTVMAIAVTLLIVANGPSEDGRGTAGNTSPTDRTETAAERVASRFLEAYGAFDANEAMTYLAEDADVAAVVTSLGDEGLRGTTDELPLYLSMLDAMRYEQGSTGCAETGSSGSDVLVHCTFYFHQFGSQEFGWAQFTGSSFDLTVRDGEIVAASLHWDTERFSPEMWEPFAEWVSTNHPEDAAVMYEDATYGAVHVTEGSIPVWDRRVREYVDEVGSIRPAPVGTQTGVVDGVPLSFVVPSGGWEQFGTTSLNKSIVGPQGAEAMIFWTSVPGDLARPCAESLISSAGPSGAVAAAIAASPGIDLVEGPSNITLGGYPAKRVVVSVREDVGCDPGYFFTWPDIQWGALWPETRVGDTIRVWIVDVDGTRLFIGAETKPDADEALVREVERIVGSIRFG